MEERKIKPSQRRAYGRLCGQAFLLISSIANYALMRTPFPNALTAEEQEYMNRLKTRLNKDAELVRAFGWRMEKTTPWVAPHD